MDTVLITVTLISLAMALGMGAVVAKLLREERRRSDARVAALIELSGDQISIFERRTENRDLTPPPARIRRISSAPPATTPPAAAYDLLRPSAPVETGDLFAEPERSSPWGRRFAVIGALAILFGSVLFAAMIRRGAADVPASTAAVPSAPARTAEESAAPLELAALSHRRNGAVLTISGIVRNPANGSPTSHVTATVSVFAADGTSLATASAPLDYTSVAPGDESPFVITVTINGEAARYRVGFRGRDGAPVAHVDRRNAEGVARR